MSLTEHEATRLIRDAQVDRTVALARSEAAQRMASGADMVIQGCLVLFPHLADAMGERANLTPQRIPRARRTRGRGRRMP